MRAVTDIAYSQSEFPPFAAVQVQLEHLLGSTGTSLAKIDTGATRTVVPVELLEAAGAIQTGRFAYCRAYDGTSCRWPLYEVTLRVTDPRWPRDVERKFQRILVLGVGGEAEVLLGRDILAAWHLHLDGPNARYSVS